MSKESNDKGATAPNPFDPNSLRVTGDVNTVGAEKLMVSLAVRKPNKQEFFRVHTDLEYRLPCAILEIKEEREIYLVTPVMLQFLAEDVRHVELRFCQNRQGVSFMWPVPMPNLDGRTNSWHESAREGSVFAENSWIRLISNMSEGAYALYRATGNIPDPEWPDKPMAELLKLAFKDGKLIDSVDHPIVQQLKGT
jgi:hypothetical protein